MTKQNDIKIKLDPAKLAKAREDQVKVDSMLEGVFLQGHDKKTKKSKKLKKRVAALEKENAELKRQLEGRQNSISVKFNINEPEKLKAALQHHMKNLKFDQQKY